MNDISLKILRDQITTSSVKIKLPGKRDHKNSAVLSDYLFAVYSRPTMNQPINSKKEYSMSMNESVTVSVADGVAEINFFHPRSNSLPASMLSRLAEVIEQAGSRDDVKVILLKSSGEKAFCAGASFDELLAIENQKQGKEFFLGFARVILAMKNSQKIIVGRIHGKVVGGGVGLVAACDYALAHSSAGLKLSELAIGIGPFVIGPVVQYRIGVGNFSAMSLDTEWREASWAYERGLYAGVYESIEDLDQAINEVTSRLCTANPEALSELKKVFWNGAENWSSLLENRAEISGALVLSSFTQQAIEKFKTGIR